MFQKAEALVERVHAVLHAQRLRDDGAGGADEGAGPDHPASVSWRGSHAKDAGAHPKVHPEAKCSVFAPQKPVLTRILPGTMNEYYMV